ncbi:MAG: penicillin-binding protein 2 [Parcubacteria group bacterium Gr01-1014_66]|nr:MAG: penicillin-binding protein 2 [Parcubacteria group bacterium Gr01-1014_66]
MASFFSPWNTPFDPDEILADSSSVLTKEREETLEGNIERPLGRISSFLFLGGVLIVIGAFGYYAGLLQIRRGDAFFAQSQENRFLTRPIFAPRGIIYDRNHIPLVENQPSFGILFDRRQFLEQKGDLGPLLNELAVLLEKERRFFFEIGFPENLDIHASPSRFFISKDTSVEQMLRIATRMEKLPGIQIVERYRRVYTDPPAFSHLLGFVGKPSEAELTRDSSLHHEEGIGKTGIEGFYDYELRGENGNRIIEVNSRGQETRFKLTQDPQEGSSHLSFNTPPTTPF